MCRGGGDSWREEMYVFVGWGVKGSERTKMVERAEISCSRPFAENAKTWGTKQSFLFAAKCRSLHYAAEATAPVGMTNQWIVGSGWWLVKVVGPTQPFDFAQG
jgi:hypothetical protein